MSKKNAVVTLIADRDSLASTASRAHPSLLDISMEAVDAEVVIIGGDLGGLTLACIARRSVFLVRCLREAHN